MSGATSGCWCVLLLWAVKAQRLGHTIAELYMLVY